MVSRRVFRAAVPTYRLPRRPPAMEAARSAALKGQVPSVPTKTLRINSVGGPGGGRHQSRGVGNHLMGIRLQEIVRKLLDLAKQCDDCVLL